MKKYLLSTIIFAAMNGYSQVEQLKTEKIGLTISIPHVNKIQYYDHYYEKNAYRTRYGVISGGIYYRKGVDKISVIVGSAAGAYQSIYDPTKALHVGPSAHNVNIVFVDAMYHKKVFKMMNVIGGLNFSNYTYSFLSANNSKNVIHKDKILGLVLGIEFEPLRFLSTSVIYRPAIISFNQKAPYHYISFDLRFHIPFYNRGHRRKIGEAPKAKYRKPKPRPLFAN